MKNSRLPREAAPGTDTEMNAPNILIRKKKPRKKPIETAVNTYIGNYCQRKCFNHLGLIRECEGDFNKLTEGLGDIPISFKEIKRMIDADAVMI